MELPTLPTLTNEQQEDRIILHDLAQRLMARELGFETGQIFVGTRFGQPTSLSKNRSKATEKLNSAVDVAAHLRKRIMVLSAGVISDAHWFGKLPGFDGKEDHLTAIYANGVMDGARLTDYDKLQELLVILCGIEREPGESYDLLEDQKHAIFSGLYQEALHIFNSFSEKLFILSTLVINESRSRGELAVSDERLVELEVEAADLASKSQSPHDQIVLL